MNGKMIGYKIAECRKSQGLSQSQFAEIMMVSPQAISKWERGESMPDIITLKKIADLGNKDLNYFVQDDQKIEQSEITEKNDITDRHWNMSSAIWKDADFSGLKNTNSRFNYTDSRGCIFQNSDLNGTIFKGNNIQECDFKKAIMKGCKLSSSNIIKNNFSEVNFTETIFSSSHLVDNNFISANLTKTIIKSSSLVNNKMEKTILYETEFSGSSFQNMIFSGNIYNCSFINCSFQKTSFQDASFKNTFFKNQKMKKVKFINCTADRLTYSFLVNSKANVEGITIKEE